MKLGVISLSMVVALAFLVSNQVLIGRASEADTAQKAPLGIPISDKDFSADNCG